MPNAIVKAKTMENDKDERINEAVSRLSEKARSLSKRVGEQGEEIGKLSESRSEFEIRLKMLESDVAKLSEDVSDADRRLRTLELNHDSRKEKWNTVINFIIQLAWVVMAALLLTKLGLQSPL